MCGEVDYPEENLGDGGEFPIGEDGIVEYPMPREEEALMEDKVFDEEAPF